MACTHDETTTIHETGYTGGVAVHPYTLQNPAASGGIRLLVECTACGARRSENHNGQYMEVSPWESRSARERRERDQAAAEERVWAQTLAAVRAECPDVAIDGVRYGVDADGLIYRDDGRWRETGSIQVPGAPPSWTGAAGRLAQLIHDQRGPRACWPAEVRRALGAW